MLRMFKRFVFFSIIGIQLGALSSILVPCSNLSIIAQEIDKYKEQLDEAEQKYNIGSFDDAINVLGQIIGNTDLTQQEKQRTYRLLGLTYIAKELEEEAKNAVKILLEIVPDYQTDPEQDPPGFIKLVEESRLTPEKEGDSSWILIAGGAVLAGVVAAVLIFAGGDDEAEAEVIEDLPGPPVLPKK